MPSSGTSPRPVHRRAGDGSRAKPGQSGERREGDRGRGDRGRRQKELVEMLRFYNMVK